MNATVQRITKWWLVVDNKLEGNSSMDTCENHEYSQLCTGLVAFKLLPLELHLRPTPFSREPWKS